MFHGFGQRVRATTAIPWLMVKGIPTSLNLPTHPTQPLAGLSQHLHRTRLQRPVTLCEDQHRGNSSSWPDLK